MNRIFRFSPLALAMCFAMQVAHADDPPSEILSLGNAIRAGYLSDTGDAKMQFETIYSQVGELIGNSSKCAKGRAKDLSQAYRNVLAAAGSGDAHAIFIAAGTLDHKVYWTSKMYTKCWNTLVAHAKYLTLGIDNSEKILAIGKSISW